MCYFFPFKTLISAITLIIKATTEIQSAIICIKPIAKPLNLVYNIYAPLRGKPFRASVWGHFRLVSLYVIIDAINEIIAAIKLTKLVINSSIGFYSFLRYLGFPHPVYILYHEIRGLSIGF